MQQERMEGEKRAELQRHLQHFFFTIAQRKNETNNKETTQRKLHMSEHSDKEELRRKVTQHF